MPCCERKIKDGMRGLTLFWGFVRSAVLRSAGLFGFIYFLPYLINIKIKRKSLHFYKKYFYFFEIIN